MQEVIRVLREVSSYPSAPDRESLTVDTYGPATLEPRPIVSMSTAIKARVLGLP